MNQCLKKGIALKKESFPRPSFTISHYTMIHNTIIQSFNETTKVINCSIYKIDFKTFTYKFLNAKKTTK